MHPEHRSVRRLTLAAFVPALLTVLALPFGFIEVRVAEIAGFYGLYFALPAVVAWCLDAVRSRLPRLVQRTLGVVILLVAILGTAFWLLWTGPWFIFALPPTAVVFIVAVRLVRSIPGCRIASASRATSASRTVCRLRSALYIPLFDELADPALVARLCAEAEEAGWDGVFVWDHVRWQEPVVAVADTQITLAAIAGATERIRLGPMVTPLARRRPVKVARETATLDRLSNGRLTLGVGLGSDRFGSEYSITGEELDERKRARMLDEALEILQAAWSGELVEHRGEHYTVDSMRFLPRPVQRPGVPIWVAGFYGKPRPLRRAARYQGFFPVNLQDSDQLAEIAAALATLRRQAGRDPAETYDIVASLPPGTDPVPYGAAGATWWVVEFPAEGATVDRVRGILREGPALPVERWN